MPVYARISTAVRGVFRHGLPYVMLSNFAQQGVAFLTVLFVAKLLPPSEFALFRVVLAYAAIATVLAVGGITAPILRYCADITLSQVERRWLLGIGIRRVSAISLAVALGALGLVLAWPMDALQSSVYSAYVLQLPGLALASLFLVYLQATQRFTELAFYQVAMRLVTMVLSVGAVYFFGLPGLLVAACLTAYLVCVPLWALSRPVFQACSAVAIPADFSSLAAYSVFGTAVTALGQYADVIILDLVGTQKEIIAVYSLATVFFFAALSVGGAVQSVSTPMFTALINEPQLFMKRLRRWSLLLAASAIPVAASLVLLAEALEKWFLGSDYAGLSEVLAILMLKFFLWSTIAVGGAALVGVGAIRQGAWIAVVTTLTTVAIGFPLCARYGMYGAAWTQALVGLLSAILILFVLRTEMIRLAQRAASQSNA